MDDWSILKHIEATAPEVASTKPHVRLLGFRKILCDCSLAMTMGSESPTLSPTQSSLPSLWTIKDIQHQIHYNKISKWWNHIFKQKPCHHQKDNGKALSNIRSAKSTHWTFHRSKVVQPLHWVEVSFALPTSTTQIGSTLAQSDDSLTDSTPSDSMGTPPVMLYSCRFTFLPLPGACRGHECARQEVQDLSRIGESLVSMQDTNISQKKRHVW